MFANDTTMVNGFNASMGWAQGDAENPTLPGTRVTSGSMVGHAFIIHEFDADGKFVEPPDYFPASGVNGEPTIANNTEQSVLQDRWPNRESEGYEKQGYVPKRFVARTPNTANAIFPGEYLELRYGIVMDKDNKYLYTINDLRVTGWGVFVAGDSNPNTQSNSTTRLAGNYTVYPGAKFKIAIDSDNSVNSRNLCVLADGHGSGLLVLGGDNNFVNVAQTLWMNGSLTDFTGPVHLVGHSNTTIQFAYDNSFPADPASPLNDGLIITNGVIAKFTGNATIGPNRKVQLFANAYGVAPTIYVENGKTVRIESAFTATGGLNKTGNGTLVFAHPAFGDNPPTFTGATTISQDVLSEYVAQIEEWMKHLALVDATVAPQKRSAEVSVTVAHFGDGATSADVYFAYGLSADTLGDPVLVESVSELNKTVTVQLPELQPDTTYYYAFFATNNASPAEGVKVDGSFTTVPLDPPSIADVAVTAAARRADVSLNLVSVGEDADSAEVFVAYGTAANALTTTNVIDAAATPGAINYTIKNLADNKTYYCAITVVNDLGNSVTTSTFSFKTPSVASAPRLWVGGGTSQTDGSLRWDDSSNWADGIVPTGSEAVHFLDNTTATIEMPAWAIASSGEFAISNNCNIVLKKSSEVDGDIVYKFSKYVTLPETSSLTLSGSHVWFSTTTLANYKLEGTLTVTDGAYFQLSAADNFVLSNNLITVEKKSKFGLPSKNITLAGETQFILDDSELLSEGGSRTVTFKDTASLVFKGKAPYAYVFVKGGGASYTPHLIFNIPEGGYDRIPVVNSTTATMPNAATIYCSIDSEGQVFSSGIEKVVPLIASANAVHYSKSQNNMVLDAVMVPEGSEAAWVYRTDVLTDADVAAGTYAARDAWSDAEPRSDVVANTVKTLGVYIKGGGEPSGPVFNAPEVAADKRTATVSVSLKTFGDGAESAAVYFACGESIDALGDYTLVKNGAAVGEVLSVERSGLDPETKYYYSFIASNNLQKAGTVSGNFETLPLAPPLITGVTITPAITEAAVSMNLASVGDEAESAVVLVAYGTDVDNLEYTLLKTVVEADLSDPIRTTLTDLEPDTEYYCVLFATNNLVPVQSVAVTNAFRTLPIEHLKITGPTATGKPGAVDLSLSVDKFGEGASSVGVSVIYGTSESNLNNTNDFGSVTSLGKGDYLLGGLDRNPTTYWYAFVVTNGLGEVLSTTTNSFTTGSGTVSCLWVGKGEPDEDDGSYRWDDWRNWECGVVPAVKPKNQLSGCDDVYFLDNTKVTIEMPMKTGNNGEYFGNKFVVSNNCDIVLNNPREAPERFEYFFNKNDNNVDNTMVLPESSSLTLSGCMMYVTCRAQSTFSGDITITDGGYLKLQGANIFSNSCVTVEKDSKFGIENNTSGRDTVFAGKTEFVLNDSELAAITAGKKIVLKDEAKLELKGKAPYCHVGIAAEGDASAPHLIFNIPAGGYERVPVVTDSVAIPSAPTVYCTIDPGSAAFNPNMDKVVTLISGGGSICYSSVTNNLVLEDVESPRGTETAWVYRNAKVTDAQVASGTYDSRDGWSNAVPRSDVPENAVKTLGVYINGASAWADEDKNYTLRLIKEPVYGTVENISLYGDTYRGGTEVTVLALPDFTCEFLGWYDADGRLVSEYAAYTLVMIRDTELEARFSEPTEPLVFMNIECEQVEGTHGKFPITITTNWLAKAFNDLCPDGVVTADKIEAVEAALNARDEVNGLNHVWMNYVLGQLQPGDPNGRIWIRADQTRDPETLRFRMQELAVTRGCGFKVRYRLDSKDGNGDYIRGEYAESGSFEDEITSADLSHRVIDLIFIPTNAQSSAEFVTTVNTAGVLKVESSKKAEILASPWAGFSPTNNPAVKATDYVKASCLTTNDVLYVYDRENANYVAWTVRADGTWKSVKTYLLANGGITDTTDATRTNAIPRGTGVWLERHDVTKPIYLYGQVDGSSVTTRLESGFNLIGSPLAAPFDVRTLPEPTTKDVYGDHIAIPTDAEPINSYYIKDKGWSVQTNVIETIVNPRTGAQSKLVTPVWTTDEELLTVPAGHGFWYYNKDGARDCGWTPAAD